MKKGLLIKNLSTWLLLLAMCVIALGKIISLLVADLQAGADPFWPGVAVLFLVIVLLLAFSVTRIIKYIRRIKE